MPLSPLKLAALQRPRFALGSRNEFFSSLLVSKLWILKLWMSKLHIESLDIEIMKTS